MATIAERIVTGIKAGITAFRESAFSSTPSRAGEVGSFASYASRSVRYQTYWTLYENTVYREMVNSLATKMRSDRKLYRSIRSIYNPSFRLGEFWSTHLMGGGLDPKAGDGEVTPSALPILDAATPGVQPAISRLWKDSNWQTGKSIWNRYGAIMGDGPVEVTNDPIKGRLTLVPVDPRKILDFTLDAGGNCRGYTFEEMRPDPRPGYRDRFVRYTRTVERGAGEDVVYRTSLDDSPYAWGPEGSEWVLPYGFVPFVWAQHLNVGAGSGWSEFHADLGKIFEVDDQASALNDHVRRMSNAPFAIAAEDPNRQAVNNPAGSVLRVPRPGSGPVGQHVGANGAYGSDHSRDQQPILWLGKDAGAVTPMVTNLSIGDTVENIANLCAEIERDFPELRFDRLRASGDASGEALRIARQPAEAKVLARRTSYDDALVRAHQMAIAIGGFEGYEGYQGFGLDSYAAGALDHRIGDRPVFGLDEIDRLADEAARFAAVKAAADAGIPLSVAMRRAGFSDEEIQVAATEKAAADAKAEALAARAADQPKPDDQQVTA